jgi:hypothetical protein
MSTNIVDLLIEKAKHAPMPSDGDEIVPDVGKPKRPPQVQNPPAPKPAETLPAPETVITPAGVLLRVVIACQHPDPQVFEAENYEQLSAKLTKALTHANRFIDRLSKENAEMKHLIASIKNYLGSLVQLEGDAKAAELEELTRIIQPQQSE